MSNFDHKANIGMRRRL